MCRRVMRMRWFRYLDPAELICTSVPAKVPTLAKGYKESGHWPGSTEPSGREASWRAERAESPVAALVVSGTPYCGSQQG